MTPTAFLGLALAVGAPALKEKDRPAVLAGEWVIAECTVGGKPSPAGSTPNRWVFNADGSRSIRGADGKELVGGTYTTDPKAGTLDLMSTGAPEAPYLCRYKVDGDTLMLNVGWQKAPRPEAFESPANSQCTLYVMRRVRKD
jgi:uncharacterized protein (TIGR03067 family)